MREIDLTNGVCISAKEQPLLADDAGAVTWDAGLVMAYYLVHASAHGQTAGSSIRHGKEWQPVIL